MKIDGLLEDLAKVPFCAELSASLKEHKSDLNVAHKGWMLWLSTQRTAEEKLSQLKDLNEGTKKAMDEMKEASRRIKSAGLGRTESEAEDARMASARWDLC